MGNRLRNRNIRNRRRKRLKYIVTTLIALAVMISGILLVTGLLGEAAEIKDYKNAISKGDFYTAKAIKDEALSEKTGSELEELASKFDELIKQEYASMIDLAKKQPFDSKTGQKYVSLEAFVSELTPDIEATLTAATDEYINGAITLDDINLLYENLYSIGLATDLVQSQHAALDAIISAREQLEEAKTSYAQGDYQVALEVFLSVPANDSQNYPYAQQSVKDIYLKMAKDQSDAGKHEAAVNTMNRALEYLPNDQELLSALTTYQQLATTAAATLVEYTGPIEHVFTHCLIAYPEIANAQGDQNYWIDCITPLEFTRILENLYEKDYILVDIYSIFEETENGGHRFAKLMLPQGKKPLVFSFDDVVYDSRKLGKGMVDKLIIGPDGNVCSYTKHSDGTEDISYTVEFIPILDKFVEEHPDFSHNGAKGALALTGFEGILGYRTQRDSPNRESEIEEAKKVVKRLKETGWTFINHTYGHGRYVKNSMEYVQSDVQKWKNEVQNVVEMDVSVLVWPFGNDNSRVTVGDPKYDYLKQQGYVLFCGVGGLVYNKNESDGTVFMDRRPFDGTALWNHGERLAVMFDVAAVRDPVRPSP